MQTTVLLLCVAAAALAAPAPQYRGDGTSKRTSPARYQNRPSGGDSNQQYSQESTRQRTQSAGTSPARYQNRPSGGDSNQQYSQESTRQRTQSAPVARSPAADRGSQQYSQESTRQRTQSAPAARAPLGNGGSQQYSQESTRQRTQPAPAARAPLGNGGSQQYSGDASSKRTAPVPIIRYQNSPTADGGNQHAYKTGNGIEREEGVFIKELTVTDDNGKQTTVKVPVYRGSFKYQQADGTFIEVQYQADETGFHAVGDSIPQALQ